MRDDIARTTFTLTTLGGHAKLELDFVERHAGSATIACELYTVASDGDNDQDC